MDHWTDLPLFPLRTVLFPGMVLPLHIFEDRYRLMINHCLEEERPFGVVLIRDGQEVGGSATPHQTGTAAVIAGATRLEDGRLNIVTVGSDRFRLRQVRRDRPYLVGDAEPWPLSGGETEEAGRMVAPVRALLAQYLDLRKKAQGDEIEIEGLPSDPKGLALLVAIALQVPLPQKQGLLDQPHVYHMLRAEHAILQREALLLEYIIQTQEQQWEGGHSGYLAKN